MFPFYALLAHLDHAGTFDLTHHQVIHNETGHIIHLGILFVGVLVFLVLAPSRYQEDRKKQ